MTGPRTDWSIIGRHFGALEVVSRESCDGDRTTWRCRCECGQFTIAARSTLIRGHKTSCGCLRPVAKRCVVDGCKRVAIIRGACEMHGRRMNKYNSFDLPKRKTLTEHIFDSVMPIPESGCWIWMKSLKARGYGQIAKTWTGDGDAHRASWRAFRGPIPAGLFVCHKCDIKPCVNPDHLFLGTHTDNMRDMARKGRSHVAKHSMLGSINPMAKLSEVHIPIIRTSPLNHVELGKLLGVSAAKIQQIRKGRAWKHVP